MSTDADHRLERVIRDLTAAKDYDRIELILEQLCNEYAYAVHQPHARNGGLIGLAAAGIALGGVCYHLIMSTCFSRPFPFLLTILRCPGTCSLLGQDSASSTRLFYRSRCQGEILCMRGHVQHRQGRQGGDLDIFQRHF